MTDKLFDFRWGNIDLFRSEDMQLVQLMIPAESARDTIAAIGEVGMLQFKDLNADKSAFQRTYANQVKRCDEMARKLRFFAEEVAKSGQQGAIRAIPDKVMELDELEGRLEALEAEMLEVNANSERLARSHFELSELQFVLEKAGSFFDSARVAAQRETFSRGAASEAMDAPLLESAAPIDAKVSRLGFVAGTIATEKLTPFERLLFRATRGNMFLRQAPIGKLRDPAAGAEPVDKAVFVVFYAGERARAKILKICEAFAANRYPFPEDPSRQRQMHAEVTSRLRDLHTTIQVGDDHRKAMLLQISQSLEQWTVQVRREKAIYHTLNKLSVDVTHKVLVAEAWCPTVARPRIQEALRASAAASATQLGPVMQQLATHDQPPTYFRTTMFTSSFQAIVDAYGIARYREVNPAVMTIMTFPFLFAVMFGDLGHGILMLMFAVYLVYNEKKFLKQKLDEIFGMAFGGRYIILLMALFSLFTGIIYNEFFSMQMSLWGPTRFVCFMDGAPSDPPIDLRECQHNGGEITMAPGASPYPIGVDPVWHGTKTELPFLNSLKMKMSILLGVTHMNVGIINSLFNHLYFKDNLSIICEFIPQMIFLNSLFGYLCMLIVGKWASGSLADLYHVMIYMFLSPGELKPDDPGYLFSGQGGLQVWLVLIAFIAVPWMLVPKPYVLKKRHEEAQAHRALHGGDHEAPAAHGHGGHGEHGEFEFGEVMVHQMIHTIEFVLGAVSNTASYLRLWALSLAHSQLSAVFYDRVLMLTISMGNPVAMFIGWFVWALATLGVLMVMESLSAFLHALRLHWVESQNKFYRGDGYQFAPFDLAEAVKDEA